MVTLRLMGRMGIASLDGSDGSASLDGDDASASLDGEDASAALDAILPWMCTHELLMNSTSHILSPLHEACR